ncbi:hypothetical protein ACFL1X_14985 [Candidatus Hydrogenedentota bacterium]
MQQMSYEEKLDWFKQNERPEVVLQIADNASLIKIIVAWPCIALERKKLMAKLQDDSENGVWEWLWSNVEYCERELLSKSGVQSYGFKAQFNILTGNRVIYPDGTVNTYVQRFLREKVVGLFGGKSKTGGRKARQ